MALLAHGRATECGQRKDFEQYGEKKKKKLIVLAYHMCHRKGVKKRNEEEKIRGLSMGGERCASD